MINQLRFGASLLSGDTMLPVNFTASSTDVDIGFYMRYDDVTTSNNLYSVIKAVSDPLTVNGGPAVGVWVETGKASDYQAMWYVTSSLGAAETFMPDSVTNTWYTFPVNLAGTAQQIKWTITRSAGVTRRIVGNLQIRHIPTQAITSSMVLTLTTS